MKEVQWERLPYVSPVKLFPLLQEKKGFVWLDSGPGNQPARYSCIGFEPFLVIRSKGNRVTVECEGSEKTLTACPFEVLRTHLDRYRLQTPSFFAPGALGYLAYDLGWQIEKLPQAARDDLNIPDMHLGFYQHLLVFDHRKKKAVLASAALKDGKRDFRWQVKRLVTYLEKILEQSANGPEQPAPAQLERLSSNLTYNRYVKAVEKIKDYIEAGDVYQINFSQRLKAEGTFSPSDIYLKLRRVNPTAYAGYLDTGPFQLLCNSPELFLFKKGRYVATRPMKGTRPRGKNRFQDERYRRQLLASIKDQAELIMIVDLERNDLGRVCEYGTVRVRNTRILEKYRTVFQTTSLVEGTLRPEVDCVDLLQATFPGGSITGAPKIRAMEIIEELEPTKRSFYTGSLGYIGFNGELELNILIRTILLEGRRLYYPVGGGIVWDSRPDAEYQETITKAQALFLALGLKDEKEFMRLVS